MSNDNTGHGHVRPRPDGVRARCGGPGPCAVCSAEAAGTSAQRAELGAGRQPATHQPQHGVGNDEEETYRKERAYRDAEAAHGEANRLRAEDARLREALLKAAAGLGAASGFLQPARMWKDEAEFGAASAVESVVCAALGHVEAALVEHAKPALDRAEQAAATKLRLGGRIIELEAENAKLREALERIRHRAASAYHCKDCNQTACSNANLGFTEEVARAALQPAPERDVDAEIEQARRDVQRAADLDYFGVQPAPEEAKRLKLDASGQYVEDPKPPPPEPPAKVIAELGLDEEPPEAAPLSRTAELSHARAESYQQGYEKGRAQLALAEAMARSQMSVILYTVGGTVDGRPTASINYLQRLSELVEKEARLAAAQAELKDAEQAGADWRDERDDARQDLQAAQARAEEAEKWAEHERKSRFAEVAGLQLAIDRIEAQRDEAVALLRDNLAGGGGGQHRHNCGCLWHVAAREYVARLDAAKPKQEDSPNSRKLAPPEEVP